MRSSSSKLKPWVQTARPSTNDPKSEVRFIERRLLNDGTIELACPGPAGHVNSSVAHESRQTRPRWTNPAGSPIAGGILRGVRVRVGQVCGKAGSLSHTEGGGEHQNRFEPIPWLEFVRSGSPDFRVLRHHGAGCESPATTTVSEPRSEGLETDANIFRASVYGDSRAKIAAAGSCATRAGRACLQLAARSQPTGRL